MVVGKGEDGGLAFERIPAGMGAAYSMLTGEAKEYHAQMLESQKFAAAHLVKMLSCRRLPQSRGC